MNSFWDERYSQREYVYGEMPNLFFAENIANLVPGKIVLPCDGEGRNAVHAARNGWDVYAFDLSEVGKLKAEHLALKHGVIIDFQIKDAALIEYPNNFADNVALIYAHLPELSRKVLHKNVIKWLKPGGKVILEAFTPLQLNNHSGGPRDISMLYTKEMLREDFKGLNIESLEYEKVNLNEGRFHDGIAEVIRMIAIK